MKILAQFAVLFLLVVSVLKVRPPLAPAQGIRPAPQDRAAIERLYRQDVEATLSGRADDLAKLWDNDAVRIQPGSAPQIGKAAIYATDKREERSGAGQSVCYKPEIKDLQLSGDWAFEWGYFSYKKSASAAPGRGKVLRGIARALNERSSAGKIASATSTNRGR